VRVGHAELAGGRRPGQLLVDRRRDAVVAAPLARRAEVGRAGVHAHALRLDPPAAAVAQLAVAAVHREASRNRGGDPPGVVEVGAQLAGRLGGEGHAVVRVELVDRRERAQAAGEQHLRLVDVADARGDPLIEQEVADGGTAVGVGLHPTHDLTEVGVGLAQVGAETPETGVAVAVELAERLDHGRVEADGDPVGHLDDHPGRVRALAPALARPVQVPRARHAHVGVQHDAVVPRHLEVLAVALDPLDDPALLRAGPGEARGVEAGRHLADERDAQRCCGPVDRVAFRHHSETTSIAPAT
jgi:hypothetical protein